MDDPTFEYQLGEFEDRVYFLLLALDRASTIPRSSPQRSGTTIPRPTKPFRSPGSTPLMATRTSIGSIDGTSRKSDWRSTSGKPLNYWKRTGGPTPQATARNRRSSVLCSLADQCVAAGRAAFLVAGETAQPSRCQRTLRVRRTDFCGERCGPRDAGASLGITKGALRLSNDYARLLVGRCPTLLTPAVCGEEGPLDRAPRAGTHTVGHNSVATVDVPRESVLENRGNAQPEYPLRGFPR